MELMTGAPLDVARDSIPDEDRAGAAPAGTPFADSVVWLGRRLATTLDCNAGLTRRDGRRVRAMFSAAVDGDESRIAARAAATLCETLRLKLSHWRREPCNADLPMIALVPGAGYRFVFAVGIDGAWICEGPQGRERLQDWPVGTMFAAVQRPAEVSPERTARGAFDAIMNVEKSWVVMAATASTIASVLVLATSLYSMQVYDRVIGQGGVSTLIVLTVGTVIAIAIEFALKLARSAIVDKAVHRIDLEAAQNVFQRMLSTRLDQYPPSVGTFAAQVRSYEGVRAYIVARKLYFFTDVPFALFFLAVIFMIGGPFVAGVPALAFVAAVAAGLRARRAIEKHSAQENLVGNQRYGLLVETIQGAEFLKASGGEWQMRARWNDLSRRTSDEMTQVRHLNEKAGYISGLVQQISYISMVATGAYLAATSNSLTVGAAADPAQRSRRLRIGYVTGDMHGEHPVSLFMRPVLARHDREAFEITVYSLSPLTDDMTRRARGHVDRWRDAASISNTRLAQMIEDDGIDVLIDLIGHTGRNRAPLFARRAAPVQAMFLGYPSTTGIPNIDWLISDPVTSPADRADLYTERLEHVPGFVFCYAPERDFPFPDYGQKHRKRPLTFGSFNNVSKLTPYTIRLWAKAIVATPGSRLVLKGPSFLDSVAVNRFGDLFVEAGVSADRLEFRGPSSLDEMMAEYADIDIALDCFPYNGGTTSCQALWMGTPVITLVGESFVQRMGAGLMTAIGRPEWVAQDEEEFVRIAVSLASDRAALLEEKRTLRQRFAASPAGDIDRYTRDLEDVYRRMWSDFASSEQ